MTSIQEIAKSKKGQKVKVSLMTQSIHQGKAHFKELISMLETGSDVEKGTCADVIKHVAQDNPGLVLPHLDTVIGYIDYKAPRVRWGTQEAIAYVARRFPDKIEKAVPKLLANTADQSTVVRWCAAFALTEIILNNGTLARKLLSRLEVTAANEKNNGIRNVYLKAFRTIRK